MQRPYAEALTVWDIRVAGAAIWVLQLHAHAALDPPLPGVRLQLQAATSTVSARPLSRACSSHRCWSNCCRSTRAHLVVRLQVQPLDAAVGNLDHVGVLAACGGSGWRSYMHMRAAATPPANARSSAAEPTFVLWNAAAPGDCVLAVDVRRVDDHSLQQGRREITTASPRGNIASKQECNDHVAPLKMRT